MPGGSGGSHPGGAVGGSKGPLPPTAAAKRAADRMAPYSTSRNPSGELRARPARPTASGPTSPPDGHREEDRSWAALPQDFRSPSSGRCPPCRCRPAHRGHPRLRPPRQPPPSTPRRASSIRGLSGGPRSRRSPFRPGAGFPRSRNEEGGDVEEVFPEPQSRPVAAPILCVH